jgi:hypothetical protein
VEGAEPSLLPLSVVIVCKEWIKAHEQVMWGKGPSRLSTPARMKSIILAVVSAQNGENADVNHHFDGCECSRWRS